MLRLCIALFTNEAARQENDLCQSNRRLAANNVKMEWKPISTAPFDRDLELAVLDGREAHALVFPCRRILSGWVKAATNDRINVSPTHWREWQDPAPCAL